MMILDVRKTKTTGKAGKGEISYMDCTSDQAQKWTQSNGGNAFGYMCRYAYVNGIPLENVTLLVNDKGVYIAHVTIDDEGIIHQDTTHDTTLVHQFNFAKSRNVQND